MSRILDIGQCSESSTSCQLFFTRPHSRTEGDWSRFAAIATSAATRQLPTRVVDVLGVNKLHAETDHESVALYRAMGWTISNLGEKYQGIECFDRRW
jgi:hypothetical protein